MPRSARSSQALGKLYRHWNDTWKKHVFFTLLKVKITQEDRECCLQLQESLEPIIMEYLSIICLRFMSLYWMCKTVKKWIQQNIQCILKIYKSKENICMCILVILYFKKTVFQDESWKENINLKQKKAWGDRIKFKG